VTRGQPQRAQKGGNEWWLPPRARPRRPSDVLFLQGALSRALFEQNRELALLERKIAAQETRSRKDLGAPQGSERALPRLLAATEERLAALQGLTDGLALGAFDPREVRAALAELDLGAFLLSYTFEPGDLEGGPSPAPVRATAGAGAGAAGREKGAVDWGRPRGFTGQVFATDCGVPVLVGSQADLVAMRAVFQGEDLWFEVNEGRGACVMLRTSLCRGAKGSRKCFQLAADLAAYFSSERRLPPRQAANGKGVQVVYTSASRVAKKSRRKTGRRVRSGGGKEAQETGERAARCGRTPLTRDKKLGMVKGFPSRVADLVARTCFNDAECAV